MNELKKASYSVGTYKLELPSIVPYKPKDKLDIKSLVTVDTENLDEEFKQQAGYYAWVSAVYAEAKAVTRQAKNELEVLEAKLSTKARDNEYAKTIVEVKQWVIGRPEYQEKLTQLHEAQLYEDILQGAVRSLEQRKDMIVQLGANHRQELDPELRLLVKKVRDK